MNKYRKIVGRVVCISIANEKSRKIAAYNQDIFDKAEDITPSNILPNDSEHSLIFNDYLFGCINL